MSPERFASLALVALCFSHLTAIVVAAECAGDSFSRPFSYLSDANITKFLEENPSLPVALNDVRFVRFADEQQLLVRGLIIPSLYDQRVTMLFARLHSYTSLRIDPSLDKLIDSIDDISWVAFFIQFLVAPSYPLYRTISQMSSDSSIDEWLQSFFLILSVIELIRFAAFVIKIRMTYERPKVLGLPKAPLWRVLTRMDRNLHWNVPTRNFACVAVLSAFSYFALWRFAPNSVSLLLSNCLLFALPAWYLFQACRSVAYAMQLRRDISQHNSAKIRLPAKLVLAKLREMKKDREAEKVQQDLEAVKAQLQSYEAKVEVQKRTYASLTVQLDKTEAEVAELEKPRPSAGADAMTNEDHLREVTLPEKREEIQTLRTAKDAMKGEIAKTENAMSKLESDAKSMEEAVKKMKVDLAKAECDKVDLIKILKSKCIPFENIELGKFLGNGCFGYVLQATFFGEGVAVKFGQSERSGAVSEFLMEVCMLQSLIPTCPRFFMSLKLLLNESFLIPYFSDLTSLSIASS